MGLQLFDELIPINCGAYFDDTATAGFVQEVLDTTYRKRYDRVVACSNDTVDRDIQIEVGHENFTNFVGTVTVPAGAGYGTVPTVDVLAALGTWAANGFVCDFGDDMYVRLVAALSTGKQLNVSVAGGVV